MPKRPKDHAKVPEVLDCTKRAVALANVRSPSIPALFASGDFVVEISPMWEGCAEALWNGLRTPV